MAIKERRYNFKRIAPKRTEKVLDAIRSLEKCSSINNYSYEKSEVEKIFRAINSQLRNTKASFMKTFKNKKFEL